MFIDDCAARPAVLDRNAVARAREGLITEVLADSATRILAVYDRQIAVVDSPVGADLPGIRWFIADDIPSFLRAHPDSLWLYLGETDGTNQGSGHSVVALVIPDLVDGVSTSTWRSDLSWRGLREMASQADSFEASLALPAVALANWHVTALFCGRCGGSTHVTGAGWVRTCRDCGVDSFPRTDSAVIMAITDDSDRLLLGNSVKWEENRFSTLAGFVEPGETLESAVRREVFEESGVVVGRVEYFASQPWPFPASLMLGYFGHATETAIVVDEQEIRSARWFTRSELRAQYAAGEVSLPGTGSIARRLIETWLSHENPSL